MVIRLDGVCMMDLHLRVVKVSRKMDDVLAKLIEAS